MPLHSNTHGGNGAVLRTKLKDLGEFKGISLHMSGRNGIKVPVRCIHKTFTGYFNALAKAGFSTMPDVYELHVGKKLMRDSSFFEPLHDLPLHIVFHILR